jgi:DNA-binding GntR family transcriptional regulator
MASPSSNGSNGTGGPAEDRLAAIIASLRPRFETAQDLALEALREAILEGVLQPGEKLRQEDLATTFSTSRIPVREALRVLVYEGLVESEPHRGFSVTRLSIDEIEEVYELRTVLEGHAVRMAIPLLTENDLDELGTLFDAMESEVDPDRKLMIRERFYLRLYTVTARPRLVGLISRLRQDVARSLRWKLIQHSPNHHDIFWEAVREGDADRAATELASHYRKVASLLRRVLREAEQRREPVTR